MGRIGSFPTRVVLLSSGGFVVSPGGCLLSNGTKRGLEDFLVCGGRFLGANHFLFWQALLPFEFQLSTGLLPPRPAARWLFFGGFDA